MTLLKKALRIVDRNSLDCSDLLYNSGGDSFLCIDCQESTNKEQLVRAFENEWNEFVEQYMEDVFEYYPIEEYDFEVTPDNIGLDIQIEGNRIIVNFLMREFTVYGDDIPDFFDFGPAADHFFKTFMKNSDYAGCTYECVLMISQDFGVTISGGIKLYSNVEDNEFTYSFNRLLPKMLEELQRQWNEEIQDKEESETFLSLISEEDWIPKQWYEQLSEKEEMKVKASAKVIF